MFDHLLSQDLVLHVEPVGATWHHLFRETFTTPDGVTHSNTALGCGTSGSRFSDPRLPPQFRVWYGAADFRTAFLETVVRDIGEGHNDPVPIAQSDIFERRWSLIGAVDRLRLADLSEDGCTRMRIDTDTAGARSHALGRQLSMVLHDHRDVPDGIRFRSRITGTLNIALYDRAFVKLSATEETRLVEHPELPDLIDRYNLKIVRRISPRR